MFCPYCGKPNEDDAAFCAECGQPIHAAPGGEDPVSPQGPAGGYASGSNDGGYNPGGGYAGGNNGGYNPVGGYSGGNNGYTGGNGGYTGGNNGYTGGNDGGIVHTDGPDMSKPMSRSKTPLIIVCAILAVAILAVGVVAVMNFTKKKDNKDTKTAAVETTIEETTPAETAAPETKAPETVVPETSAAAETTAATLPAQTPETTAATLPAETSTAALTDGYGIWRVNCPAYDKVTLRTEPRIYVNDGSISVQGQTELEVLDIYCSGYFKVKYNGIEGYILGSYLEPSQDATDLSSTATLTATEGGIHLLDIPHVSGGTAEYLATIGSGETVTYYDITMADQDGKYYYFVEYKGIRGYVVTEYQGRQLFR